MHHELVHTSSASSSDRAGLEDLGLYWWLNVNHEFQLRDYVGHGLRAVVVHAWNSVVDTEENLEPTEMMYDLHESRGS